MTFSKSDSLNANNNWESKLDKDYEINSQKNDNQKTSTTSELYQIPLLEEKLQVSRSKRKVGEVVVRKEVETRLIQVPIRREKLIVERIGENPERLAEVILEGEKVNGFKYEEFDKTQELHITKSYFLELPTAQKLLEAVSRLSEASNAKIRLEIVSNSSEHQIEHQSICDRFQ